MSKAQKMKNPMKHRIPLSKNLRTTVLVACGLCGTACTSETETDLLTANNFSKRCSLTETRLLAGFNSDTDGFVPGEHVTSLELIDSVPNWPYRLHEGAQCLQANCPDLPANVWRTVVCDYPDGLDLSQTPVVSFGINTVGGAQAADYYVRLTLENGSRKFESVAQATTNDWNVTIFDLNDCPFLDDIRRVEFGFMNNSDSVWRDAAFQLDGFEAGKPIDLSFTIDGSAEQFTAEQGTISQNEGCLLFDFEPGGVLISPSFENSRNRVLNPPLQEWNTLFFVMENRSSADKVRLEFITEEDRNYDEAKSKTFDMEPNSPKKAYYFNLSDIETAQGSLMGFRLVPLNGSGELSIDRISFEQEEVIEPFAGEILSCTAANDLLRIEGNLLPEYAEKYKQIAVYVVPMYQPFGNLSELNKLYEGPAQAHFVLDTLSLKKGDGMTHMSSRFLAVVKNSDEDYTKIAPYFYVENWRDFSKNPYAFTLPDLTVSVLDYGAKGDGFTDDTRSIQAAIDDVAERGGGRVVFPGDSSRYGRRYVATNLMMRNNIDLHLEAGAILWQSQDEADYTYHPAYGHDVVIPGVPWTHSLYVNLPLIQAKEVENIKITGPGKIRSADRYCVDSHLDHYARTCTDRIHIIPIGFWKVRNVELTDFEMVRTNNYHTSFYFSENIFIGNIKMHEVKCVSGDGIGVSMGTHDLVVDRIFFESNDDCIVLTSSYGDPRGGVWWWEDREADHTVYNVGVYRSYLNSGGGKAIALIPWGTTNPDQGKQGISDVQVYDCVLKGGYSVGTWPDNPFDGKPFDNTETDDYVAVKNFRIFNNEYLSPCDLLCVRPTNFLTDCGIHSSSTFRNGDFSESHSYWTMEENAGVKDGYGYVQGGRLYEGLYLTAGHYVFRAEVKSTGTLFVESADTGDSVISEPFESDDWTPVSVSFDIPKTGTYYLGISGEQASVRKVEISEPERSR